MTQIGSKSTINSLLAACAVFGGGVLLAATFFQTCLSSELWSQNFVSKATRLELIGSAALRGKNPADVTQVNVPFLRVLPPVATIGFVAWMAGAAWLSWLRRLSFTQSLAEWGWYGWFWWATIDLWEWLWITAELVGLTSLRDLLSLTPNFWLAGCLAGWLTTLFSLHGSDEPLKQEVRVPKFTRCVWLACGIYILTFVTLNWMLYYNLLIPHGDSAMYEEHLWNLLHGKGFRSYLDRGLFFGEHIQFVHLFLLPLYVIWPSHLLLEACSSIALALGAFPVYWMVLRHTQSDRTAVAAAVAYLLYAPMQALDIEIDLKTFRPESFGIPLLLLTLDQLDRKNVRGFVLGILACLTVKEDYTLIFGPLGLWIVCCGDNRNSAKNTQSSPQPLTQQSGGWRELLIKPMSRRIFGLSLVIFSVGYLWLVTRVIMPWFRSGVEVHYTSYFAKFGNSPEQIVRTMLSRPGIVVESLINLETALYALALLAPLAFVPLCSPARLLVGVPLFGILCLNELEQSRSPQHQFHAPLVAVLFWAMAAGLPYAQRVFGHVVKRLFPSSKNSAEISSVSVRHLLWTSSLTCGMFFTLTPLGTPFWDSGSMWYWKTLYLPGKRAAMFARIKDLIPRTARVASTDFVHPRYTHFERSYDYSEYQRVVSGEGKRVPNDTDYIVIDTTHQYSKIKMPNEVPEYRDHPDQWELVPDQTEGYFIVLKRRMKDEE